MEKDEIQLDGSWLVVGDDGFLDFFPEDDVHVLQQVLNFYIYSLH